MTSILKKIAGVFLAASMCGAIHADFNNDFQVWSSTKVEQFEWNDISFAFQIEFRSQDGLSELGTFNLSQKISTPINENHKFALNLTYETSRSSDQAEWRHLYRPELEISSRFKLSENWNLDLRNRMELTFKEGEGNDIFPRYRGRALLKYQTDILPNGKWIGFGNEFFYDFDADRWNQNRIYPVIAAFSVGQGVDLEVYYMINTKRSGNQSAWDAAHVLGFNLGLDFWK